jgi:hypothetical protein
MASHEAARSAAEPRWVDLRWRREAPAVDRNDPRLRDCGTAGLRDEISRRRSGTR